MRLYRAILSSVRLLNHRIAQPRHFCALQTISSQSVYSSHGRCFSISTPLRDEAEGEAGSDNGEQEDRGNKTSLAGTPYVEIDPETSMRYMESNAYYQTYGSEPVWLHYRRNFKGQFLPKKTRKTCVRAKMYSSGNPCPICRDNHLVPNYRNVKLLKQFISPYSGQVLHFNETNVCQKQHHKILVAVEQAWDYGLIDMPFTRRGYDYRHYYPDLMKDDDQKLASEK